MVDIQKLLTRLISEEGGYVNNPNDSGGPTKYGITQRVLSAYLGRMVSIEEMKNLDIELAKELYEKEYYIASGINTLPDDVQPSVLDMAVNAGVRRAIQILQRVINSAGFGPVDEDGALGPQTRVACQVALQSMRGYFINAYAEERIAYYDDIALNNTKKAKFLEGWRRRASSFEVQI